MKKLINQIGNFLRKLISKGAVLSEAAVKAVNYLKLAVDSGALDVLTMVIPGKTDDKVLEALKKYLPMVAIKLQYVNRDLQKATPESILAELVIYLKSLPKLDRGVHYEQFAAMVYKEMMDNNLTIEEAVAETQYRYFQLKKEEK